MFFFIVFLFFSSEERKLKCYFLFFFSFLLFIHIKIRKKLDNISNDPYVYEFVWDARNGYEVKYNSSISIFFSYYFYLLVKIHSGSRPSHLLIQIFFNNFHGLYNSIKLWANNCIELEYMCCAISSVDEAIHYDGFLIYAKKYFKFLIAICIFWMKATRQFCGRDAIFFTTGHHHLWLITLFGVTI